MSTSSSRPNVGAARRCGSHAVLLGLSLTLLSACQSIQRPATQQTAAQALSPLPVQGSMHYVVQAAQSDVRFLVYRDGPLGFLGHNHVIQAKELSGDIYVAPEFAQSGFELKLPVDGFKIDAADARAVEGADFAKQPSDDDIAGTREHMLGSDALDITHFPEIHIRSVSVTGTALSAMVVVRIDFHGVTRDLTVPVQIEQQDDRISVAGQLQIDQTDFSVKPFSFLGGAIRVADVVAVRFKIAGTRA
jgi:hypothetical protein